MIFRLNFETFLYKEQIRNTKNIINNTNYYYQVMDVDYKKKHIKLNF